MVLDEGIRPSANYYEVRLENRMLGNLKAIAKRSLEYTTCGKTTSLGQKASHNIDKKIHVNNGVTKTFSYRH